MKAEAIVKTYCRKT